MNLYIQCRLILSWSRNVPGSSYNQPTRLMSPMVFLSVGARAQFAYETHVVLPVYHTNHQQIRFTNFPNIPALRSFYQNLVTTLNSKNTTFDTHLTVHTPRGVAAGNDKRRLSDKIRILYFPAFYHFLRISSFSTYWHCGQEILAIAGLISVRTAHRQRDDPYLWFTV